MTLIYPKKTKLTLFSVLFTFFIDNLSWSIVFPIFAPYFLDPKNVLFSPDVSDATRSTILGLFLMAFSLGQFLGAPLIGEYADRYGRRKALIMSVFFTLIGIGLSAWSMQENYLVLLFIGRLITGIFASNMSICLACVSDLSDNEKTKGKNFGYLSVIAGLSFLIGAFFGGKLSDPTISKAFSANLPLWIATGLTVLNLFFVFFGFKETFEIDPSVKFDLWESFRNIGKALQTEKIKRVYTIYLLFIFAWTILFQFTPVLLVENFSFTNSNIGDLALFMGICWAMGSGYLNKLLVQYFSPKRVLEYCLIGITVFFGLIVLPDHIYGILGILGLCVMFGGLAWPLCTSVISNMAPREIQGKILGISQSVQSFAMTLAPLIGGLAFHVSMSLPFIIGTAACLSATIIYFTLKDHSSSRTL